MRYRVNHWMGTWEIDLEAGMLWLIYREHKKKKIIEHRMRFKQVGSVIEALKYLSEAYKKPVFELRKYTKKMEG